MQLQDVLVLQGNATGSRSVCADTSQEGDLFIKTVYLAKIAVAIVLRQDRSHVLHQKLFLHCMQTAVLGSSLLAMVPPSCVGLAQHARLGNVDWRMAAALAAGTAVGSFAGSKVAVNAPTGGSHNA